MTPRFFITLVCFTIALTHACKRKVHSEEAWIVSSSQHAESLFSPGDRLNISDTYIYIVQSGTYLPIVKDEAQLLITVNENKRLFHFIKSDSLITLTEQYETPQAIITLKKYTP